MHVVIVELKGMIYCVMSGILSNIHTHFINKHCIMLCLIFALNIAIMTHITFGLKIWRLSAIATLARFNVRDLRSGWRLTSNVVWKGNKAPRWSCHRYTKERFRYIKRDFYRIIVPGFPVASSGSS